MRLSEQTSDRFFEIWIPLLAYTHGVRTGQPFPMEYIGGRALPNNMAIKENSMYIAKNQEIISRFIASHRNLKTEERKILKQWKRYMVHGAFPIVAREGEDVVVALDNGRFCLVQALKTDWEEIVGSMQLPVLYVGVLMPFLNGIITDGLMMLSEMDMSDAEREDLQLRYRKAKAEGTVRRSFPLFPPRRGTEGK